MTVRSLIEQAEAELRKTTISHASFKARVAKGVYDPKDGSGTAWGKAFAALAAAKLEADGPPPAPPPATTWPTHGIATGYKILLRSDADHDWELDQIRDVGAQFVRVDSTPGNQFQVDRFVAGVLSRGMEPLLILHGSTPMITPAQAHTFAHSQASKWRGKVRLFEFCNEPDLAGWTPEEYTAALKGCWNGLKVGNPQAVLFAGALWKWKDAPGQRTHDWIRRMYVAGAKGHFDAPSLHLYDDPFTRDPSWNIWDWTFHIPGCVREIMDANGDAHIPIVSTENGAPANKYGEARQAEIVANDFEALTTHSSLKMHTVFSMTDDDSADDFALLRADRSKRPAWQSYRDGATKETP